MCMCLCMCFGSASLAKELLSTHPRVMKWMLNVVKLEGEVEAALGSRYMGSATARQLADDAVAEVALLFEVQNLTHIQPHIRNRIATHAHTNNIHSHTHTHTYSTNVAFHSKLTCTLSSHVLPTPHMLVSCVCASRTRCTRIRALFCATSPTCGPPCL